MNLYNELLERKSKIAVVGLGYVGMPLAVAFSKKVDVIGYDNNPEKIQVYRKGIDPTNEVGNEAISNCMVCFTSNENKLREAGFIVVAVPTPVNTDHTPNLAPVISASEVIGRNMSKGTIVVYESTVYPGVTEEICVPVLEKESGMICGRDFFVGYSPERINPGDKIHTLETITKIVSGMDEHVLDIVASVYELIIEAGVYRAESIKVAEAAKVIENSQRDVNIAFMNELSIIFNKMGIDTKSVLEAAGTKWNFMKFYPGLVGGHCIGVDPWYLTYKAEEKGYHSQIILAGRRINDGMGKYVAENIVKLLIKAEVPVKNSRVGIMGITFKENCPDTRNSHVIDIVKELKEYGVSPIIYDPVADAEEAKRLYGITLAEESEMRVLDALVIAVAHSEFATFVKENITKMFIDRQVIIDVKGILNKREMEKNNCLYWRL